MIRGGYVYMMANLKNTAIYAGVTADLLKRVQQHKDKTNPDSHTAKYNITKLVYYRGFQHIEEAIAEEKRIKGLTRKKKFLLVSSMNPEWKNLTDEAIV